MDLVTYAINKKYTDKKVSELSKEIDSHLYPGNQQFNKNGDLHEAYYNNDGLLVDHAEMRGQYIRVRGESVTVSGAYSYIAFLTSNMGVVQVHGDVEPGTTFPVPEGAKYIYVAVPATHVDYVMVNYGEEALPYEEYTTYTDAVNNDINDKVESLFNNGAYHDYTRYHLPYIRDGKLRCNKDSDDGTAYYAFVDCGEKVNHIIASWIWEPGTESGVVCVAINPNGCYDVKNITDLSLHLVLTANHLSVDVLGQRYGMHYYQQIIFAEFTQALDGVTEHSVELTALDNDVYAYVDGVEYRGTFVPDDNIASLDGDVLGQYAVLEHYCEGDRNQKAMPMFTSWKVTNRAGKKLVYDYFDRQDGQLSTTPQGLTYALLSNTRRENQDY